MIDKILYFFGYAPIELKTEYKHVTISKEIEFDKLQSEMIFIDDYDSINNKFHIDELKKRILKEVENRIEFFVIKDPDCTKIMCRLYVNKIKTPSL